jgi:hypothetical protein
LWPASHLSHPDEAPAKHFRPPAGTYPLPFNLPLANTSGFDPATFGFDPARLPTLKGVRSTSEAGVRPVRQEQAHGVLVTALGTLAEHFGSGEAKRAS